MTSAIARAREFFDVVTGLWDSWADDAFIRDVESGVYLRPRASCTCSTTRAIFLRARAAQHRAAGQGWPVIVQAGASEPAASLPPRPPKRSSPRRRPRGGAGILRRCERPHGKAGRDPTSQDPAGRDDLCRRFARRGEGEAREARQPRPLRQRHRLALDRARPRRVEIRSRRPLPEIPERMPARAGASARSSARRENLTVRQLAQRLGGHGGLALVGTPKMIADQMEEWLEPRSATASRCCSPSARRARRFRRPRGAGLQRRGIFRREYEGATLRENLGLPRPENRFFK